ncbi:6834_t:CDS:2 [Cetraspora pellucida]|uniref:6834_t:CDS:1 n=1 Tax=Cetraspora pellucida TaxID=1433469 RepID=A0A9N9JVU4_9GLOM|nr:6834_t:CDS:2 [Cetraspora pellucida]
MLSRYEESVANFNNSIVLLKADVIDYYSLDLNKALEVSLDDKIILARRADVHRILERYEEALEDLNDLLETDS